MNGRRDTDLETDGGLEPHSPPSSPDGDPRVTSATFVSGRESSTDSGTVVLERGSSTNSDSGTAVLERGSSNDSATAVSRRGSSPDPAPSSPDEDSLPIPPPSSLDGDPRPIPPPSSLALVPYASDDSDSDTEADFPELVAPPSLVEPQESPLGHEFVRAIDNFLGFRGHISMLELCQAPFVKGCLDDLLQHALDVLHIVTVVPRSRKMILDSKLSNNVNGLSVILDSAEFFGGHMRTEIIRTALEVLVNLVCPLPKPAIMASEWAVVDQGSAAEQCNSTLSNSSAVGQLQQWYRQASKDICTNHGVKVLLAFLEKGICSTPRIPLHRSNYRLKGAPPPAAIARLRALACGVLLAVAADGTTALQLKVLQVGEKLTDLISTGSLTHGAEESRWHSELSKSAIELIQIVMNAGHGSTLKASDFGMPTFRRIEGEAVAATTAVTFDHREFMYLIHEHLLASGYSRTAGVLLEEAQLEQPVPAPSSAILEWPSGRSSDAFFPNVSKNTAREEDRSSKCDRSPRKKAVMRKCNLKSRNLSQSVQPMLAKTRKRSQSDRDIYSPSGKRICIDSSGKGLEICKCACPKPSLVRSITARLGAREISSRYSGVRGKTGNQQFLYSRFRASRTCFDKRNLPWTCISYLSDGLRFAIGSLNGDLEVLDSRSSIVLHSVQAHERPVVLVSTRLSGERDLVLSSSSKDVMLWDACIVGDGPLQTYHECRAATFCNSRDDVAVLSIGMAQKEILLYDMTANSVSSKLSDPSGHSARCVHSDYYYIHFNPTDTQLLWNGVLWDTRTPNPVHHFEQFTDFGGGGFHPAGNEVIISSEVWDVRNFKLLKQVPHLKQTDIKFNSCGDVIYTTRRRDQNLFMPQPSHPLFNAFRTVDAKHYTEIATIPVNSVVYDLCTERTDSLLGLLIENPHISSNPQFSTSVLVHKIGHQEPTNVFAGD